MKKSKKNISTRLSRVGLNPKSNYGIPNPPVYHASTILYPNSKSQRTKKVKFQYGRTGTPTSDTFCNAIADLYEADGSVITPSGLAAAVVGILSFVQKGSHILVTDSAYGSTRNFISKFLPTIGVDVEFYSPTISSKDFQNLIKENTSLVYFESPGSLTFELQDLPRLSKITNKLNITTIADNTWGTILGQNPLNLGISAVIESYTKYVSGHSDVMMGGVIARDNNFRKIKKQAEIMGQCTSPDDIYLALRGLRTMEVRLEKSFASSVKIANWISKVSHVKNVFHPATIHHPDNKIFKRDFNIGAGLFSFELTEKDPKKIDKFIDSLELFGIGASWGGFESLILHADLKNIRYFDNFKHSTLIRLAIGLENPEDLIDDLNKALNKLN